MTAAPRIGIPPLGGVCTLEEAARLGYGVEENVSRLLRYHWAERRLGEIMLGRLASTPEWEVKGAFSLHQWLDGEHADTLRRRIAELRHPAPRLDEPPSVELEAFFRQLEAAEDTVELLTGLYAVARHELNQAYRRHLDATNPLVDHPTCRILRTILAEEDDIAKWGKAAIAALTREPEAQQRARLWDAHLRQFLARAGGLAGDADPVFDELPPERPAHVRDTTPARDARFAGSTHFDFPPHVVYALSHVSARERNLALLCKRLLEMDVPEMMSSFLVEDAAMPWEHQLAYRRQLWDEARHSMMGEAALEAAGVNWTAIPLNVGFSLRLNRHATPRERELMLYAIEQSLMPAPTGKRFEYETAIAAGDPLSALIHDYDWADEVLHAQIGRRWLREAGLHGPDVTERGRAVHERTWRELQRYRQESDGPEWWFEFVEDTLGAPSGVAAADLHDPEVVPSA
jgi:hypothetical protein